MFAKIFSYVLPRQTCQATLPGALQAKVLRGPALLVAGIVATLTMAIALAAPATSSGAMAWGLNASGQLGNGSTTNSRVPVAVSGLSGVTAVQGGNEHSLALLRDGTVMAWGNNNFGQLGNGSTATKSSVPVAVSGLSGVTAISCGSGDHSLALLGNGTVMAWGRNTSGQLGNGTTTNSSVPVAVSGLSGVKAISGGGGHSLALLKDGTVMAWGNNASGQLGNGSTATKSSVPVAVSGLSGVTAVQGGGSHSLALLGDGTVMAWGSNEQGQLGNGTTTKSAVPVAVSGLSGVTAVSGGQNHSLALLGDGSVMAWGFNKQGQLGNGSLTSSSVPVAVSGLSGVTVLGGGANHTLALLSNGTVMAWGYNVDGQLGNGTTANSSVPVAVSGPSGVTAIAGGALHSLASSQPTVTSVNPNAGPQAGGTTVTITGTNFTGATAVTFGATAAASFAVNSATSITAVSPAGTGTVDVTVTTAEATSAEGTADQFSYIPVPVVTSVTPNAGPQAGGTKVIIRGTGFVGLSSVQFGSTRVGGTYSETEIAVESPAGTGMVDVTVSNASGTSAISPADQFSYVPPPTVTKVSPAKGPVTGGTTVTITGTNFSGATAVMFGSTAATSFTVKSATSITAASPPETAGTVFVTVTTPGGTSAVSLKDRFKFTPTITSVSPKNGPVAGATTVTVAGTGFVEGKTATTFKFGTTKATSVNCTSTTTCTVVSPAHAAAKVDVVATVNKVSSPKVTADKFTYS